MKCEIIRDLLPSYMDGLTSEESNMEIETHMEGCELCSEILQQMRKEMEAKEGKDKRKINPFRKFNRRMRGAVAGAVAVCICLGGLGYKAFGQGFSIDPNEITMDVRLDGDMLCLDFALEKGNLMHYGTMYDETSASIDLRKVWALPGDYLGAEPNRFSWGMNLDVLTVGTGERMEVQMADGSLTVMEASDEEDGTIQDGDKSPVSIMMFQEGGKATSIFIGGEEKAELEDYTINIDYGNQTES
ncbi:zf-HC2 domain-containing protein, partial [Anaerotignum sp.]